MTQKANSSIISRRNLLLAGSAVGTTIGISAIPKSVQAKPANNGLISVKDFGAIGDGINDDTNAIKSAIYSGQSIYFGGVENNYRVSSQINLPDNTYIFASGASITTELIEAFVANSVSNIHIEGFRFDGNGINYRVLRVSSSNDINIINNQFENMGNKTINSGGNSFLRFDNTYNILVTGNTFRDSSLSFIFLHSTCKNVVFSNNIALNCSYPNPSNVGLGVHVDMADQPGGLAKNIVISGNVVSNCGFLCHVNGCHGLTVTGNTIEHTQNGIVLGIPDDGIQRSSCVSISGNSIIDSRDEAMTIRGCNTVSVTGNTIDHCEYGIATRECNDINISSNSISNIISGGIGNSNGQAISIRDCQYGSITSNSINSFTHYGISLTYDCSDLILSSNQIFHATDNSNKKVGIYINSVSTTTGFSNISIKGNRISDVYNGIECRSGSNFKIQDNDIDVEKFGIKLDSLDGLTMTDAFIENNLIESSTSYGIRIDNSGGITDKIYITGNTIESYNNIRVSYSGTGKIQNNNLTGAVVFTSSSLWKEGVDLRQSTQRVSNSIAQLDKLATHVMIDRTTVSPTRLVLKSPLPGRTIVIKDSGGNSGANNITIDGDGYLIDNSPSITMSSDSVAIHLRFYDNQWYIN